MNMHCIGRSLSITFLDLIMLIIKIILYGVIGVLFTAFCWKDCLLLLCYKDPQNKEFCISFEPAHTHLKGFKVKKATFTNTG